VTKEYVQEYLTVDKQAEFAEFIVNLATKEDCELTIHFIEKNVSYHVRNFKKGFGNNVEKFNKEENEQRHRKELVEKAEKFQKDFCSAFSKMASLGNKMRDLKEEWPNNLEFPIKYDFRIKIESAKTVIDSLLNQIQ
jgi:hypothetical protein